ncbi:BRO family protein [Azospirillum soli]|uniref:BRO-N domain-containing protein n=1 Tax=Azospirillum soli TaxID=1304799 RepID=UPI003CCEA818
MLVLLVMVWAPWSIREPYTETPHPSIRKTNDYRMRKTGPWPWRKYRDLGVWFGRGFPYGLPALCLAHVRTVRVVTINGAPWLVGPDILRVLFGTTNGMGHIHNRLDPDQMTKVKRVHLGMTPGKDVTLISESGLYKLVMRSDKPEAQAFQDWVTREVLPAQTPPPRCAVAPQDTPKLPPHRSEPRNPKAPQRRPPRTSVETTVGGGTVSTPRGRVPGHGGKPPQAV